MVLNEEDLGDLQKLLSIRTMRAVDRHQMLYKIFLRAKCRPYEHLTETERKLVVNTKVINTIEKRFSIAEW